MQQKLRLLSGVNMQLGFFFASDLMFDCKEFVNTLNTYLNLLI